MANIHSFAADYSEARDKFLAAARVAGATTYRYDNPAKGPRGEALSTDVARLGPDDASKGSGDDLQHAWRGGLLRLGLPGRLAGQCRRRRPAEGYGRGVRPRDQSLRLCLDAARDGRGQRPQPQLRRSQQALSGERGLSRDRRFPRAARLQRTAPSRPPMRSSPPIARRWATSPISVRCRAASTAIPTACSSAAAARPGRTAPCTPSPTGS